MKVIFNENLKSNIFKFVKSSDIDIDMLIVCKIENEFNYPEQYIVDCLQQRIKNDATTCYYLLKKEDKDEIINLL